MRERASNPRQYGLQAALIVGLLLLNTVNDENGKVIEREETERNTRSNIRFLPSSPPLVRSPSWARRLAVSNFDSFRARTVLKASFPLGYTSFPWFAADHVIAPSIQTHRIREWKEESHPESRDAEVSPRHQTTKGRGGFTRGAFGMRTGRGLGCPAAL